MTTFSLFSSVTLADEDGYSMLVDGLTTMILVSSITMLLSKCKIASWEFSKISNL